MVTYRDYLVVSCTSSLTGIYEKALYEVYCIRLRGVVAEKWSVDPQAHSTFPPAFVYLFPG